MPKIVRSIHSYQNNIIPIPIGKESFYNLGATMRINNKLPMISQLPLSNPVPVPVEDASPKYHSVAKYGASKYTSSLQSGKMHKLIHNNL
jgi:hypothetical protein